MIRKKITHGLTGLTTMGVVYGRYHQEKAQALLTLRAGSQLLNRVEFAMQGEGKPILILHGGFGGYEQGLATAELLRLNGQIIALSRPGSDGWRVERSQYNFPRAKFSAKGPEC